MDLGTEEEFPRMREPEAGMGTIACVPEVLLPCRGQQDNNQGEAAASCLGPGVPSILPFVCTPPAGALLQALLPGRRTDAVAHDAGRLLAVSGPVVFVGVPPTLRAIIALLGAIIALLGAISPVLGATVALMGATAAVLGAILALLGAVLLP